MSVDGTRISRRPEEERARIRGARIGMLFQQANLVGHLSVADNIALAQRIGDGTAGAEWREQVLERCGIEHRASARPSQLSGGELARAGLAVALANDPPVILADEPTGELDSVTAARVLELLRERAGAGAGRADRHPQPRGRRRRGPRDTPPRRKGRADERPTAAGALRRRRPHLRSGPDRDGRAAGHRLRGARRSAHRARRPLRIGQVDAAAPDGRPRRSDASAR